MTGTLRSLQVRQVGGLLPNPPTNISPSSASSVLGSSAAQAGPRER